MCASGYLPSAGACVPLLPLLALAQPPPAPAPAPNLDARLGALPLASPGLAPAGAPAASEAPGQALVGWGGPSAGGRTTPAGGPRSARAGAMLSGTYPAAPVPARALPPVQAPSPAPASAGARPSSSVLFHSIPRFLLHVPACVSQSAPSQRQIL